MGRRTERGLILSPPPPLPERSVPVGDLPLSVTEMGAGDPILMVHGFGATRRTWRKWTPTLAMTHRVLLVDLRGSGDAPAPGGSSFSPAEHGGDLVELIVRLGLRNTTLVGHSLGGGIQLLTLLGLMDRGEDHRIDRLALLCATAYEQRLPPLVGMAGIPVLPSLALALLPAGPLVRGVLGAITHPGYVVTRADVAAYRENFETGARRRAMILGARNIVPEDLATWVARYAEIAVPTLLLWGKQDRVVPLAVGERLAAAIPAARLEILDPCGHLPQDEYPESSLALFTRFLG